MFNLLVYPYLSERQLMEEAIIWSCTNRNDKINVYFYYNKCINTETCELLQKNIRQVTGKDITLVSEITTIKSFNSLTGDKGVIDLRRNIPVMEKFLTHKKRYEDNIPVVFVGIDRRPVVLTTELYNRYLAKYQQAIEEERIRMEEQMAELERQRQKDFKKSLKRAREKRNTAFVDDKYFISEETGAFYFYKPVNLEHFSFSAY